MLELFLAFLVILAATGVILVTLKLLFFWIKLKLIIATIIFALVFIFLLITAGPVLLALLLL